MPESGEAGAQIQTAVADCSAALAGPAIERDIRSELTELAKKRPFRYSLKISFHPAAGSDKRKSDARESTRLIAPDANGR
jgi:hypothetical protein